MDRVHVERIGGFAGFGLPGSHLESRGEMALSELSHADRSALDALFVGTARAESKVADGFRYRITRETATGTQTIEAPEADVPLALRNSVRDVLR